MPAEQTSTPSFMQRLKSKTTQHWRCWILAILLVGILIGVSCLGYHVWTLQTKLSQQQLQLTQVNEKLTQQKQEQITQLKTQQQVLDSYQTAQQQLTQRLQKLAVSQGTGSSITSILGNLTNQVAIIQLLLTNQQFSLAINLLTGLESELALLPEAQQQTIVKALEGDKERIQQVQTATQQLIGQLQQLQQHINQQLLAHFGPAASDKTATSTPAETSSAVTTFFEDIEQQLRQAIQIQHTTSISNPVLPAFYSGVMLQLALYQAQFALTQGNWMEYQLALTSVQAWLTPATLSWLTDMPSVMQTVASLAQQPPAFSAVNVNATQQALFQITQESVQ